ncbi:calmodulin-binding transcription activator 1-like isoform X1 [Lingula anatina]|uniref:Calmodulin-binding transcription activator 1-like isoform X1 n=1 Tax=Lingula anatina TaxID=7574 RepID=A0A2R2ML55_LINAN|nr:calmodulin-binding transcription activator 1-like isoform X1 [Lingula anatina]|eukprot:XP_023930943.1 calmodulin-binding transcription activator 1-like isoform X1 [Lingula anatina]
MNHSGQLGQFPPQLDPGGNTATGQFQTLNGGTNTGQHLQPLEIGGGTGQFRQLDTAVVNRRGGQFQTLDTMNHTSGSGQYHVVDQRVVITAPQIATAVDTSLGVSTEVKSGLMLPKGLDDLPSALEMPRERHRWNTNEEIASILVAFSKHAQWQQNEVGLRPASGSMLLYSRKKVRYRKDGYTWKKRKDGKTTREDHMKLKVRGVECIYGCYVHSALLSTFHRRCYWLLQNPDIVLVHYLNVPSIDDAKLSMPSLSHCEKKEWSKEELITQLKPMFAVAKDLESGHTETLSDETLQSIVQQMLSQQHQPSLPAKTHECLCEQGCTSMDTCTHTKCRIISPKSEHLATAAVTHKLFPQQLATLPTGQRVSLAMHNKGVVLRPPGDQAQPLILNLSQLQASNGLIILSGNGSAPISIIDGSVISPHQMNKHKESTEQTGSSTSGHPQISSATGHNSGGQQVVMTTVSGSQQTQKMDACDITTQHQQPQLVAMATSPPQVKPGVVKMDTQYGRLPPEMTAMTSVSSKLTASSTSSVGPKLDYGQNLDLSPDEIHKTLTANLPLGHNASAGSASHDAMDTGSNLMASPPSGDINFDAFDMLELSDLDQRSTSAGVSTNTTCTITCASCLDKQKHQVKTETREGIANITDFAPDWAFSEGNTKILVTGPWYSTTSPYSITFDGVQVPAALVQSGVLRCFCPPHSPGLVTMQVACEGFVISNSVVFEYKTKDGIAAKTRQPEWTRVCETQLKLSLLQRLEAIEKRLSPPPEGTSKSVLYQCARGRHTESFEHKVIHQCEELSRRVWVQSGHLPTENSYHGMTLLHLAAALGYAKLINALIKWRTENPNLVLEYEVDALSLDDHMSTPLLWACALGKTDAALVLYHWNRSGIEVCNRDGLLPLSAATSQGHLSLVSQIEMLEKAAGSVVLPRSPLPQTNPCPFLSVTSPSTPVTSTLPLTSNSPLTSVCNHGSNAGGCNTGALQIEIPGTSTPKSVTAAERRSKRRAQLKKRFSVDSSQYFSRPMSDSAASGQPEFHVIRSANSDPHINSDLNTFTSDIMSLDMTPLEPADMAASLGGDLPFGSHRDTLDFRDLRRLPSSMGGEVVTMEAENFSGSDSPIIDVEAVSSDDEGQSHSTGEFQSQRQMVTLANQIIAAMPERIKLSPSRADDSSFTLPRERSSSYSSFSSYGSTNPACTEDSGISTPMGDPFALDESRYPNLGTPPSSVNSPESSCLHSPYSFTLDSPPPTTQDFTEYFNAPAIFMERDFSQLTLSDEEQRRLYEAAKVIQSAYKKFRDKRNQQLQRQRQIEAAILIQNYYRRYKQYVYTRKMSSAAVLIQSQFRSYAAQKRFKKTREAALLIQNQYRAYKEQERLKKSKNEGVMIQQRFRSHYQRRRKVTPMEAQGYNRWPYYDRMLVLDRRLLNRLFGGARRSNLQHQ